ncbi:unnamed protein product [Auanema sp. JU1783]|nr:unnamed protein product [Auanema sp. JU1783]
MKLIVLSIALLAVYVSCNNGMDLQNLGQAGKRFFADMTKKAMGVPSLKPENLAAQSFFRTFLDKYTRLDDNVKQDMMKHVPAATKIFNMAAQKFNVNPEDAFKILSSFFMNIQNGAGAGLAQQGLKMAGKMFQKTNA